MRRGDFDKVRLKLYKWCARKERSLMDVQRKLKQFGTTSPENECIIEELIQMDYLNPGRFSAAYVHDKFHFNKWGKTAIIHGLQHHKIAPEIIEKALKQIDDQAYKQVLTNLLETKWKRRDGQPAQKKAAVIHYARQKGYELDLIYKVLDEISKIEPE